MKGKYMKGLLIVAIMVLGLLYIDKKEREQGLQPSENKSLIKGYRGDKYSEIYLAGGCFWGVEAYMERVNGVIDVTSGYANGTTENPSYEDVIFNDTGHAETVHVKYDANVIDLQTLLEYYFKVIDPTSINKQGNDMGSQYRTGIYYVNEEDKDIIEKVISKQQKDYEEEIVVEVLPLDNYYLAEDYHQDYLENNPTGYCHIDLNKANEKVEEENEND